MLLDVLKAALRVRCCDESQSCKGMISVRIAIGCTCRGIPGICFSPVLHICFLACAACLNGMRGVHVSALAFVYQLRYWHRLAIHSPSYPIIKIRLIYSSDSAHPPEIASCKASQFCTL